MRALILKDLIVSGIKLKYLFYFFCSIFVLFLFAPLDDYIPIISYSLMLFAPLIFFLSIQNYIEKDDYKSEIMYPIRKRIIVLSRFLEYFLVSACCIFGVILLLGVRYFTRGVLFEYYQINLLATGIGMSLIYGSLVLLLMFIFGQKHIKEVGVASFILTLIPVRIYMEIVRVVLKLDNVFEFYNHSKMLLLFIVFSVLFYFISCMISTHIFLKKEL